MSRPARSTRASRSARGAVATGGSRNEPPTGRPGNGGRVVDLASRRVERDIQRALPNRARYKYVQPRVEREGLGWKVVSPNCSRNIDPDGGEIDIAWLVPCNEGDWLLYARDHAEGCWRLLRRDAALQPLLDHLCADPGREFWQ